MLQESYRNLSVDETKPTLNFFIAWKLSNVMITMFGFSRTIRYFCISSCRLTFIVQINYINSTKLHFKLSLKISTLGPLSTQTKMVSLSLCKRILFASLEHPLRHTENILFNSQIEGLIVCSFNTKHKIEENDSVDYRQYRY